MSSTTTGSQETQSQVVILKDILHLYGNKSKFDVTITETGVSCVQIDNAKPRTHLLEFKDIVGCDCMKGRTVDDTSAYLTIYAYPHKKKIIGRKTARSRETLTIKFDQKNSFEENQNDVKVWRTAVSALLNDVSVTSIQDIVTLPERSPKQMLVLVNPFSGPGKALQIFQQKVVPVFAEAGVHFKMVITERQNHAKEIVKSMALDQWCGVVIVSGDGLIYEVVNGLMQRPDWEKAIKTPIGCLPGGSGNALACSINKESGEPWTDNVVLHSSFVLVKHKVVPMDLVAIDTLDGRSYSFLSVTWGLIADIDIESERFRSLGGARFTVEAVARLINLRQYRGKLSYLPIQGEAARIQRPGLQRSVTMTEQAVSPQGHQPVRSTSVVDMPFKEADPPREDGTTGVNGNGENGSGENGETGLERVATKSVHSVNGEVSSEVGSETAQNGAPLSDSVNNNQLGDGNGPRADLPPLDEPVPDDWVTIEDDFVHVSACYQTLLGADIMMTPESKMNDGFIYLCFTRIANTSKKQLLAHLVNMETGAHLKDPAFEMVKVKAFRLEPITPNGHISVDGEEVSYGPIQGYVLPGMARVMSL